MLNLVEFCEWNQFAGINGWITGRVSDLKYNFWVSGAHFLHMRVRNKE